MPYRPPDFASLGLDRAPPCRFEPAPADGVLPEGFASTTNFPTYVNVGGSWRLPERHRMDSHLVWDAGRELLATRELRTIRRGELVAVAASEDGREGLFVWCHGFDAPGESQGFAFMASEVSREKPVDYGALADRFLENRGASGVIVWVIGPALVHARGREALEWMIHQGFCHVLFAGNAVAVHDVEAALYGSTLGMRADGSGADLGHGAHMRAINEVRGAGSIAALVAGGRLHSGIMHALTVTGTPFVLAGSIRDDGPIPETITDALDAQDAMREHTTRATMAVVVATALHGIATGNMLPTYCRRPDGELAEVTTICVDQTEFAVSKLRDRGTHQAFGVVTNAQDFMRLLQLELEARVRGQR